MIKITDLSLDEKLTLLTGKNDWELNDLDGKIPRLAFSDGPNGCRALEMENGEWKTIPAHCYPALTVIGNSWNVKSAYSVGECMAYDFIERNRDVCLGPGINIKRTPFCGRNFEYISEDPYLAGIMAKNYIEGLQDHGVGACVKHFAANNREGDRIINSSEVDDYTMHEVYLKNFKIALEAKPWTLMCSYNKINGVYASENIDLLENKLRKELNYNNVIVSDWFAVQNRAKALKASLDIDMPTRSWSFDVLKKAYNDGFITMKEIDASVKRILELINKNENAKQHRYINKTDEERFDECVKIAEDGIVLLKNDGILPLNNPKMISLSGRFIKQPAMSGGGSAKITPIEEPKDLIYELKQNLPDSTIIYDVVATCNESRGFTGIIGVQQAIRNAMKCDVAILTVGTDCFEEAEGKDRTSIKLQPQFEHYINNVAKYNPNVIVVLEASSAVDVSAFIDNVKALLYTGFAGEGINKAIANILTGKTNPSGKLAETFPVCVEDCSTKINDDNIFYDKYTEGVFVGYKWFDKYNIPVRYPFGYGLSYSKFEYSNLKIIKLNETTYDVSFKITNNSPVAGKEISQIYVKDPISAMDRPIRQLVAFEKTFLKPYQTTTVSIKLDKSAFEYYLPPINDYYVENGLYTIEVGASSRDIRLSEDIEITLPDYTQYSIDFFHDPNVF